MLLSTSPAQLERCPLPRPVAHPENGRRFKNNMREAKNGSDAGLPEANQAAGGNIRPFGHETNEPGHMYYWHASLLALICATGFSVGRRRGLRMFNGLHPLRMTPRSSTPRRPLHRWASLHVDALWGGGMVIVFVLMAGLFKLPDSPQMPQAAPASIRSLSAAISAVDEVDDGTRWRSY